MNCLGCNTEIKPTNKYCNIQCQRDYDYRSYIEKWKAGIVPGTIVSGTLSNYVKRYIAEKYDNKCSICTISKWMDKPITLEVDHIDGDHNNNIEDNLRLICPNCHSQTPTYRAKNVGKGRVNRRKVYAG